MKKRTILTALVAVVVGIVSVVVKKVGRKKSYC
jgi:hypothetical protein